MILETKFTFEPGLTKEVRLYISVIRYKLKKPGDCTKIAISIGNRKSEWNSRFNWTLACVYNGRDDRDSLRKYAASFFEVDLVNWKYICNQTGYRF